MPMYEYACDECGRIETQIHGSLDDAPDYEPCMEDDPDAPGGICPGDLIRRFPRSNFKVQGGTPKHHG